MSLLVWTFVSKYKSTCNGFQAKKGAEKADVGARAAARGSFTANAESALWPLKRIHNSRYMNLTRARSLPAVPVEHSAPPASKRQFQ